MKQEDKQLLLVDLCARFPYGVMVLVDIDKKFDGGCISKLTTITEIKEEKMFLTKNSLTPVTIEEIRPYLRPMSSMTKEEVKEYRAFHCVTDEHPYFYMQFCTVANELNMFDWLNKNMFDYRGLLEKGFAIEAPEGMYDIKEK